MFEKIIELREQNFQDALRGTNVGGGVSRYRALAQLREDLPNRAEKDQESFLAKLGLGIGFVSAFPLSAMCVGIAQAFGMNLAAIAILASMAIPTAIFVAAQPNARETPIKRGLRSLLNAVVRPVTQQTQRFLKTVEAEMTGLEKSQRTDILNESDRLLAAYPALEPRLTQLFRETQHRNTETSVLHTGLPNALPVSNRLTLRRPDKGVS